MSTNMKVTHYHQRIHRHTLEEIMQAFTYREQGRAIEQTAAL